MKKKHLYGAMLWAFLVTANLCTGCSDDNDYPDVDGQNPTMTLATDHIESGAGHRFTIEGTLEDKDGIASISIYTAVVKPVYTWNINCDIIQCTIICSREPKIEFRFIFH